MSGRTVRVVFPQRRRFPAAALFSRSGVVCCAVLEATVSGLCRQDETGRQSSHERTNERTNCCTYRNTVWTLVLSYYIYTPPVSMRASLKPGVLAVALADHGVVPGNVVALIELRRLYEPIRDVRLRSCFSIYDGCPLRISKTASGRLLVRWTEGEGQTAKEEVRCRCRRRCRSSWCCVSSTALQSASSCDAM